MKIDHKYLPSKTFAVALIIAIIIVLTTLIFTYKKDPTKNINLSMDTSASTTESWVDNTDSDNDGLPDWKETLYGTDKNKSDTDNDGTNDKEEIETNRDPLKTNTSKTSTPNDKLEIILPKEKTTSTYTAKTQTDKFALNLLSDITYSEDASGQLTDAQIKYLANNALNNINISGDKYKGVTKKSDLNFVNVTDDSILNYINFYYEETEKLRLILNKDIVIIKETDLEKNPLEIKTLENIISRYKTITNNFIKAPLPKDSVWATTYHLAIINSLEKITQIEQDLIDFKKDPIKYAPAITSYTKANMELLSILTILDRIFLIERV